MKKEKQMKIKILSVYEQNNQLRVEVETPYGVEKFGLGINKKYLDPQTNQPKWKKEVRKLLDSKYGTLDNRKKKNVTEAKSLLNKEMSLDEFSPEEDKPKVDNSAVPTGD